MATCSLSLPPPTRRRRVLRVKISSEPQRRLWVSTKRYILFKAGIGAGKSFGGAMWALARSPGTTGIIAAPTHRALQGGALAILLPIAQAAGLVKDYHKQDGILDLVDGKRIYLRSLERPDLIRGINAHWIWGDELAVVKKKEAWDILIGRMRLEPAQCIVTTTPRGKLHWLYEVWVDEGRPETHEVIESETRDNPTLPCTHGLVPWTECDECKGPVYEQELLKEYAEGFAAQELKGQWIDLGAVEVYDVEELLVRPAPPPAPEILRTCRAWDMASTGGGGDYTAGGLISMTKEGGIFIRDMVRGQWEPGERDKWILRTAQSDGRGAMVWVPQERGAAGYSQAQAWIRMLAGFSVTATLETGDKVIRAGPLAAQMNNKNVTLTAEPGMWENYWHDGKRLNPEAARARLRKNLGMFPQGRTKDESDALAAGLERVTRKDSGITIGRHRG